METAEEYLPESDLAFEGGIELLLKSKVVALIEQAQKEAYNEALDDAAENVIMKLLNGIIVIDKDSILKLKK